MKTKLLPTHHKLSQQRIDTDERATQTETVTRPSIYLRRQVHHARQEKMEVELVPATRLPRDSVLSVRRAGRGAMFSIVTYALLGTMPSSVAASPNAVNVRNVGARGNGRADDTVAIQRSIDMAGASGIVYIPCGVYVVSASLTLPSGILLRGAGPCAVIKESPSMAVQAVAQRMGSPSSRLPTISSRKTKS
jgi:hypothetical protein